MPKKNPLYENTVSVADRDPNFSILDPGSKSFRITDTDQHQRI
jgi:hypothetical protein